MRAAFARVLLALALAGCAAESKPATPAASPAVALAPGNVTYGTIVAERAVAIPGGHGGFGAPAGTRASDVRASILAAIGAAPAEGGPTAERETEFIIRGDDGRTISVVQGNEARLKRGERVMIMQGPETRLAPLGKA